MGCLAFPLVDQWICASSDAVADGHIRLASGDHYRKPDDAARIAVGITTISGMAFWHVNGHDGQLVSLKDVFTQAQKNGQLLAPKSKRR